MKIIEQSHEIISLPDRLLETLELAGRTCYKSEDKIGCIEEQEIEDRCDKFSGPAPCKNINCKSHSSHKFIQMLIKRGHHAMIEFGHITIKFITNRGVTHELVRHRLCSFAQESTRYVKYDGEMEFIRPVWFSINYKDNWSWESENLHSLPQDVQIWFRAMLQAETKYKKLLQAKWRPEQAREVLPNSLKTEIVVSANIREWRHIFKLRCSKAAHPQMRALMIPLRDELQKKLPVVFDDLGE